MNDDEPQASLLFLRHSLDGHWGLLFTHPNDFAAYGFEADRWLAHVRAAFDATKIRPIALAKGVSNTGTTWITELGGLTTHLSLDDIGCGAFADARFADVHWTSHIDRRYVLLLDEACRLRWSFQYVPGASLPSPIELAALAEAKRREHASPFPRPARGSSQTPSGLRHNRDHCLTGAWR
jgi:hypothetical protein